MKNFSEETGINASISNYLHKELMIMSINLLTSAWNSNFSPVASIAFSCSSEKTLPMVAASGVASAANEDSAIVLR
jgi:hypothetical protein